MHTTHGTATGRGRFLGGLGARGLDGLRFLELLTLGDRPLVLRDRVADFHEIDLLDDGRVPIFGFLVDLGHHFQHGPLDPEPFLARPDHAEAGQLGRIEDERPEEGLLGRRGEQGHLPAVELFPGRVDVLGQDPGFLVHDRLELVVGDAWRSELLHVIGGLCDRLGLLVGLGLDGTGSQEVGDDREQGREAERDPEAVLDALAKEFLELFHGLIHDSLRLRSIDR